MKVGNRESGIGNRHSKADAKHLAACDSGHGQRLPDSGARGHISYPHSPFPTPHSRRTNRDAGFSLIEVIAAIMLLAITFAALMKVVGGSISLTQNAAGHSEAAMWARSELDSAFVGEPIKTGSTSGHFNAHYRWTMVVTPWNQAGNEPPNSPMHLYLLDLDVLWGPPEHPRSAHFRTLRLAGSEAGSQPQQAP